MLKGTVVCEGFKLPTAEVSCVIDNGVSWTVIARNLPCTTTNNGYLEIIMSISTYQLINAFPQLHNDKKNQ